jgi:intein/homing endonuclease
MARILYTPDLTLDQFMQVKKNEPYKDYRFKAKCFKKGTLIETNKGAVRVEDFVPEVNKGYLTPFIGDLKLKDRFGNIKDIKGTIYEESLEMFRFELENGDTFEVTPEHRFKILREGKEIEVLAKDVLDTDEFISL